MSKLVLTIPGESGQPQQVVVPSGIPQELQGGLDTAGKAFIQVGYNYLFLASLVLTVIFILFSGIQFITSGGDADKLQQARKRLLYSIIGLAIVVLAFVIVSAVVRSVGGNPQLFFKLR